MLCTALSSYRCQQGVLLGRWHWTQGHWRWLLTGSGHGRVPGANVCVTQPRGERLCHFAASFIYPHGQAWAPACSVTTPPRIPPTARSPLPQTFFPREPNVVEISSCSVPLPKKDVCWLAPPSSGFPRACMESATARLFGDTGEQRHTLLAEPLRGAGGGSGIVFTGKSDTRSRLD